MINLSLLIYSYVVFTYLYIFFQIKEQRYSEAVQILNHIIESYPSVSGVVISLTVDSEPHC